MALKLIDVCARITGTEGQDIAKVTAATRGLYIQNVEEAAKELSGECEFEKGYYFPGRPLEKAAVDGMKMKIGKWLRKESVPARTAIIEMGIVLGFTKAEVNALLESYSHRRIVMRNPLDAIVFYTLSNQKGLASFLRLQKEIKQLQPEEEKEIQWAAVHAFVTAEKEAEEQLKKASWDEKSSYLCKFCECGEREKKWLKAQFDKESKHQIIRPYLLDSLANASYSQMKCLMFTLKDIREEEWNVRTIEDCIGNTIGTDPSEIAEKSGGMRHAALFDLLARLQKKKTEGDEGYSTRILEYIKENPNETEFLKYLMGQEKEHLRYFSDGSRRQFAYLLSKILEKYHRPSCGETPEDLIPFEMGSMFSMAGMCCQYAEGMPAFGKLSTWSRNHEDVDMTEYEDVLMKNIYPDQYDKMKALLTMERIREICGHVTLTDEKWDRILWNVRNALFGVMHKQWIDPDKIIGNIVLPVILGKREISRSALMLLALYADAMSKAYISVEDVLDKAKYTVVEQTPLDWVVYHLQPYSNAHPYVSYQPFDKLFSDELKHRMERYKNGEYDGDSKFKCFKSIMQELTARMKEHDPESFEAEIKEFAEKLEKSKSKSLEMRVFTSTNPFAEVEFVHNTNIL